VLAGSIGGRPCWNLRFASAGALAMV
jgi:hypothetical protein